MVMPERLRSSGRAHPGLKALGFPAGDFTINQQAKPFGMAEFAVASRIRSSAKASAIPSSRRAVDFHAEVTQGWADTPKSVDG